MAPGRFPSVVTIRIPPVTVAAASTMQSVQGSTRGFVGPVGEVVSRGRRRAVRERSV